MEAPISMHERINNLLIAGAFIYSFATGRVGAVMFVRDNELTLNTIIIQNGKKCANFVFDDTVELRRCNDEPGQAIYKIVDKDMTK